MGKLSNSSSEFLRQHPLDKSSIVRGFVALILSTGTSFGVIYLNYYNYWKVTIYRTQTVDFNILANLLPAKVSTQLLQNDKKGLQESLDTNYGLFGIFVTDCKSVEVNCPEQRITYGSKFKIKQISNSQQRLIPEGDYVGIWAKKFAVIDTPSQLLKGSDYVLLQNPPPIKADWKFNSPRASEVVLSQQKNAATIIGRIYFVRGNSPSFLAELEKWRENPLSGKHFVYNAIAGSAILTGLLAWLVSEIFHYRSRKAYRREIEFERALRDAAEQVTQSNIEKSHTEALACLAQAEVAVTALQLNEATQAKLQSDENARLAQAEVAVTASQLNEATQAKLQSDENARLAQAEVAVTASQLNITDRQRLEAQRNFDLAQAELATTTFQLNITDRQRLEAQRNFDLAQAELAVTASQLNEATQAKLQSDENARLAQAEVAVTASQLNEATQAKLQSDENARLAQAEVAVTASQLNEATQAKLQSDENARLAQAEVAVTASQLNEATRRLEGFQVKSKVDKNAEYLLGCLNDKNARYSRLKQENEDLQRKVIDLELSRIDNNFISENTTVKYLTVSDVLTAIKENFNILNIWDNAYDTASHINDYLPRRVYSVLEILAKVGDHYFQQQINNSIISLLKELGVSCSRESSQTMREYGNERLFRHRGKSRQMEMHIKVGRQLRIYFDIDTENQKIIIGYCGRHLRTVTG